MPSNQSACHNCRRLRLRCDRSWPSCHKCASAGRECLGYGRVLIWTEGIDAQGNLKKPPAERNPAAIPGSSTVSVEPKTPLLQHQRLESPVGGIGHPVNLYQHFDTSLEDEDVVEITSSRLETPPAPSPALSTGNLTDPVFQDLDYNSRYYLAHFAGRVCKDLVARDAPHSNPFRELIPLTRKHPLLLQIIIATSAMHWSNVFRPTSVIPTGVADPGGYLALLRSKDMVSRQALIDALTAKQRAMGHLRGMLDTLDPASSEVALAAMHFFVKVDLIDLERRDRSSWRAHLEGASNILALLSPEVDQTASSRMLRDCVIADCFIYHILGSTLTSGGLAARIARYGFELLPTMKRIEVTSYLSCPSEILHVILVASQLSYQSPSTDWSLNAAGNGLNLIDQALAFDIPAWAAELQSHPNMTDIESRVHIASAHRSAACLYILQALPLVRTARAVDTTLLVEDILWNLSQIGEADPYFKATSWPTFIAGAETKDAEKRTWSLKRLLAIWEACPWGYIFTAIEMLKATWQMQDRRRTQDPNLGVGVNWLQELKGMGFDSLIV